MNGCPAHCSIGSGAAAAGAPLQAKRQRATCQKELLPLSSDSMPQGTPVLVSSQPQQLVQPIRARCCISGSDSITACITLPVLSPPQQASPHHPPAIEQQVLDHLAGQALDLLSRQLAGVPGAERWRGHVSAQQTWQHHQQQHGMVT